MRYSDNVRCVLCKGTKFLCGKKSCPLLLKIYHQIKLKPLVENLYVSGSSPPSAFVGSFGYPNVYVGPLIPPIVGNTALLDTPELWLGKTIDEIVSFRSSLIRGMKRVNVFDFAKDNIGYLTRELCLSSISVDAEAEFTKKPNARIILDDDVQPFGPSAPIKKLSIEDYKIDRRIEKVYEDEDLNARLGILNLYQNGIEISKIQRILSVGALGIKRRLVPTRWSITAVDSIISLENIKKIKEYQSINEYRIYESWELDNRFIVLLLPTNWCYELIEAWYPETIWNPMGHSIVIFSDSEGYEGRKKYARIGGCYYAARFAVSEYLVREKRQAGVVILREAHPGYVMPVGVWNVRENVRNALKKEFKKFDSLQNALDYIKLRLQIPLARWVRNSKLLHEALYQKKLEAFGIFRSAQNSSLPSSFSVSLVKKVGGLL
ncbi:MAG: Nre family DNA repair protein [Candidatus Thermoplasmatota archaeon]